MDRCPPEAKITPLPTQRMTAPYAGALRGPRAIGNTPRPTDVTPALDGLLCGLRLALGTGDPQADAAALTRVDDWDRVARLAAWHRVTALLLDGLGPEVERIAGRQFAHRLCQRQRRVRIRGLQQLDVLADAAGALAESGIPCLVIKGLPLSQRLHGNPLTRESIDIDLLVPPDAFSAAERTLRERGWYRRSPTFRETPARNRWYARLVKDVVLARSARADARPPLVLELHRRLTGNPYLLDVSFDRLHAESAVTTVGGYAFRTPGDDAQLGYLACHGLQHCWHRLKWLCDIAALVVSMDESGLARSLGWCRARGIDIAVAPALGLCAQALHVAHPRAAASLPFDARRSRFLERIAQRTWNRPETWPNVRWHLESKVLHLLTKPDPRYLLHALATNVFAPHHFGQPDMPDRLFLLYPLIYNVRWLLRIARRRWGAGRQG